MIKRKENEDLRSKNITYERENIRYKVLRFYQAKMTVDVMEIDDKEKKGIQNIPFAHIPKATKKLIKPN
ncbi:MAG: hypothetical protein U9O86_05830 [Campylobacterota bacterium]|nr:hypothetical protein [Campylobacterota bacterium]